MFQNSQQQYCELQSSSSLWNLLSRNFKPFIVIVIVTLKNRRYLYLTDLCNCQLCVVCHSFWQGEFECLILFCVFVLVQRQLFSSFRTHTNMRIQFKKKKRKKGREQCCLCLQKNYARQSQTHKTESFCWKKKNLHLGQYKLLIWRVKYN